MKETKTKKLAIEEKVALRPTDIVNWCKKLQKKIFSDGMKEKDKGEKYKKNKMMCKLL